MAELSDVRRQNEDERRARRIQRSKDRKRRAERIMDMVVLAQKSTSTFFAIVQIGNVTVKITKTKEEAS